MTHVWLGRTFSTVEVVVSVAFFGRLFYAIMIPSHIYDHYCETAVWEGKADKFMAIPDVQKNVKQSKPDLDYAAKIQGNFSWGFA